MNNKYINLIIVVVVLMLSFDVKAQKTGEDTTVNFTDISGNKQGRWVKYYDNEQVRYKGFFIDDQPQDTFWHYHPNGELKARQIFDDDGSSMAKMYWEDGNLASYGNFNKDKEKDGIWIFYYPSGEKESEVDYSDGTKNGTEINYYKNGNVLMKTEYQDGVKEGEYIFYYQDGTEREKGFYHEGERHGEFVYRLPNGRVDEKGIYEMGKRIGTWKIRDDKAELKEVEYVNGERTDRDSIEKEFEKRSEYARENPEKIDDPEDFMRNPVEYFLKNQNR
ncbi:MAG: toxin-antitoxin system YwqK family antitoxin [Bacteroidales bacterium]